MAKIICLFNHKGGVSKTTTAFNLGWKMALKGKRVLLADFDPQCNLTGMVMGFKGAEDLASLYESDPPNNARDGLAPAFESQPRKIDPVKCHAVDGNENLFLMPGHIGLAEYENTLGIAQELGGSLLALRNLPGSLRYLLDVTGEKLGADYILVDMSPSLGALNQNLLMTSDYFIVPLHPDYFSAMALNSLSATLPRWKAWAETAHKLEALRNADYPFPNPHCSFLGAVIQKYRPRNGKASSAFQRWIDQLMSGLKEKLIPTMASIGMVDQSKYKSILGVDPWQPLLEVSDFNSLIALSQEHQVPIYAITKEQAERQGAVWTQMQENMKLFGDSFDSCADKIFQLTQ